ncbi:MAG: LptF/LptG family permease [Acidobacteria bacterium]|nr:LptF/LptG family permease [Acidobacteriota bacterium]
MKRIGWLISKYLVGAILPYFAFSWLLLSVILFIQQASKFSDIFFSVNIPANLIWQLTIALVPSVIAFTCPMAMLVGTIIGLSKMQGDSELVSVRVAGVSNFQIAIPIMVVGVLLSAFAFVVNLKGVPLAAALVRSVALQTAIKKLESPIEPGVFNTEIAGATIYVKSGDLTTGKWQNIFIFSEDANRPSVRLITSGNGRIDVTDQKTELVLENATVTTMPQLPDQGKYVTESIGEVRLAVKTSRSDLINRLTGGSTAPEELGLSQLSEFANASEGKERIEAEIIWQRRITLSITPFIFCLLGTMMILSFGRGGRGFGILLAFIGLVTYYLLTFAGEQLARTGSISVPVAGLIPVIASAIAIVWLSYSRHSALNSAIFDQLKAALQKLQAATIGVQGPNRLVDLTTGIRDLDLIVNLVKYFVLTVSFLAVVFIIFTAFELWKFAGVIDGGIVLLGKYLFFLLPFIYLQIAPSAAMVATLATYIIKSRQNEIVTWTSAGQSVYRLLLPCFILMAILGAVNWQVQERLTPRANQIQDAVREQIRKGGVPVDRSGRVWVARGERIYSFKQPVSDITSASDNEKPLGCSGSCGLDMTVLEFSTNGQELQTVYRTSRAGWEKGKLNFTWQVEKVTLREGSIRTETLEGGELAEEFDPFNQIKGKPSHLNAEELKQRLDNTGSEVERRSFAVTIQKRYTTWVLPLIIALFTAPFALSLSRKGKVVTIGYAVGLWLLFMGTTSLFAQFGEAGSLSPFTAVWSPLLLFSMLGVYLLSRVRT